jgi:hypothetical protein
MFHTIDKHSRQIFITSIKRGQKNRKAGIFSWSEKRAKVALKSIPV